MPFRSIIAEVQGMMAEKDVFPLGKLPNEDLEKLLERYTADPRVMGPRSGRMRRSWREAIATWY